jgi:hypothetical protein
MLTQVITESGATYIFDDIAGAFTRAVNEDAVSLVGDNTRLTLAGNVDIAEGAPMRLLWVSGQDVITRVTTPVVSIKYLPVNEEEIIDGEE